MVHGLGSFFGVNRVAIWRHPGSAWSVPVAPLHAQVRQDGTVSEGPWVISPDVAWVDGGDVLVLDLRPPYGGLPWRLSRSAAAIWECIAEGMTLTQIEDEFAALDDLDVPDQIRSFLDDLAGRGYIALRDPS